MKRYSLWFIGFLQAIGLVIYCSLVAVLLWNAERWFGKLNNYFGPFLFLIIFSTSALVCALITLTYPFNLWQKKQVKQAVRLLFYTAGWLIGLTLMAFLLLSLR